MASSKKAKKFQKVHETHTPETFHFEERRGTMGRAEEMRNLAQEIANSFDSRVARVAALRQETAGKLKSFQQGMKNVQHELRRKAADLKRFLSNAETSRMSDFRAMDQNIRAQQEARSRHVEGMLSGFRRENKAAAGHWQTMAATMAGKRAGGRP